MFWSTPITFVNTRVVLPGGRLARTLRVNGRRIDGVDVAPDTGDSVVPIGAVAQYAWDGRYFSKPASVVLPLELDAEGHFG